MAKCLSLGLKERPRRRPKRDEKMKKKTWVRDKREMLRIVRVRTDKPFAVCCPVVAVIKSIYFTVSRSPVSLDAVLHVTKNLPAQLSRLRAVKFVCPSFFFFLFFSISHFAICSLVNGPNPGQTKPSGQAIQSFAGQASFQKNTSCCAQFANVASNRRIGHG